MERCGYDVAYRCSRPRSKERAVVVAWERRLMVVGNAPESIQYPWNVSCGLGEGRKRRLPYLWMFLVALTKFRFVLDEDSYLVPELDGVRIFSRSTHEFLHEVPGEAPTSIQCDSGQVLLTNGPKQDLGIGGRTENFHASSLFNNSSSSGQ